MQYACDHFKVICMLLSAQIVRMQNFDTITSNATEKKNEIKYKEKMQKSERVIETHQITRQNFFSVNFGIIIISRLHTMLTYTHEIRHDTPLCKMILHIVDGLFTW